MEHKKYTEMLTNYEYLQTKENEKAFEIDNKIPINLPVIHDAICGIQRSLKSSQVKTKSKITSFQNNPEKYFNFDLIELEIFKDP